MICFPSPLLQAALNGTRSWSDHSAIPIAPAQQAKEASAAVAEGAGAIHTHVRDKHGNESLDPEDVGETVETIRDACPGIPIGISTGAWIVPDLAKRLALIRSWTVVPDFASVNLHEVGAPDMIRALLDRGVGIEAGIWNAPAAITLLESGLVDHSLRILIEPAEASCRALANLRQIETVLSGVTRPRLLHGMGRSVWEFVELAAKLGYDTRAGFEDTLRLPDGRRADSNADLVAAAQRIIRAANSTPNAPETGARNLDGTTHPFGSCLAQLFRR
jgi:uncharacterized protein (DUF849 family)